MKKFMRFESIGLFRIPGQVGRFGIHASGCPQDYFWKGRSIRTAGHPKGWTPNSGSVFLGAGGWLLELHFG
jgi:hypothetical protein